VYILLAAASRHVTQEVNMESYRTLEDRVTKAGGLLEVSMEELRDSEGAGKLGSHVRDAIARHLRQRQLSVLGGRLPNDQRAKVWLIAENSPYGMFLLELLKEMGVWEGAAA
jgi:hypothetical protein